MSGTEGNHFDNDPASYIDPDLYWGSANVSSAGDDPAEGMDGFGPNAQFSTDAYSYADMSPYARSPTDYPGQYPYHTVPGYVRPESEHSVDSVTTHSAPPGLTDNFRHYCPPGGGVPYAASDGASSWVGPEDDEKRKRNTAASARFRVKKKQREQALESSVKQMGQKLVELEGTVQNLETENKWLRDLITEKNKASAEASVASSSKSGKEKKSKKEEKKSKK